MSQKTQRLCELSFENTEIAFRGKSDGDINKAYWLFKLLSSNFLTRIGRPITDLALNWGLPIEGIIRSTIFNHFCGGRSEEHTSELQSRENLVCRLLLEKKKTSN